MLLNYSHWGPVNTYPFFFKQGVFFICFGLPFTSIWWPKTHLFKTLSSLASLENVSFSFTRGQKKTEVFNYSDVRSRSIGSWMTSYIIYYACAVRNAIEIPPFNCFRVDGRKRLKYATCGRVFFFFKTVEYLDTFGRDLKVFPSPCWSLKMHR